MPSPDYELIRSRLTQTRERQRITLRRAAEITGVSAATLSRFERGAANPDLPTIDKLIDWLELDRAEVFAGRNSEHDQLKTPDQVARILRSDRNLDTNTARALSSLFRAAYDGFAERRQRDS
jgi:transcriptional regulator with XRE-family HTH domain